MLYDNSQLLGADRHTATLHAWILTAPQTQAVTGNKFFRTITEEIFDYVMREVTYVGASANDQQFRRAPKLQSKAGGIALYSTQDADSEGEEGKFFVCTPDEIRKVLGSDADEFMAAY